MFNATAKRSGTHMVFSNNNSSRALHWRGYFIRAAVVGIAFFLLSLLCRPAFAGVSIFPDVVLLSGDETVYITVRLNTRLPVMVDLIELPDPTQGSRSPNQTSRGHIVAHLARQANGSFGAAFNLNQHGASTRYFQVAARYSFLPLSRMNGVDLRVGLTQRPLIIPPDPGKTGKSTLAGVDSDHDGLRDDIEREIFFLAPESEILRMALGQYAKAEEALASQPSLDTKHIDDLVTAAFDGLACVDAVHPTTEQTLHVNYLLETILENSILNTPERRGLSATHDRQAKPNHTGFTDIHRCAFRPSDYPD